MVEINKYSSIRVGVILNVIEQYLKPHLMDLRRWKWYIQEMHLYVTLVTKWFKLPIVNFAHPGHYMVPWSIPANLAQTGILCQSILNLTGQQNFQDIFMFLYGVKRRKIRNNCLLLTCWLRRREKIRR